MKDMEDVILDDIEEILAKAKKKKPVFFLANSSSFEKDCQKYLNAIKKNKRVINRIWNRYVKKNKINLNKDNFSKVADKFLQEHLLQAVRKAYKRQLERQKNRKITILKRKKTQKKTINKLESDYNYYFQIRAYKTIKGKKQYSPWSAKKKVLTK